MTKLIFALSIFFSLCAWSQEEILNQCFVFSLETDVKTDLRLATFDLPFAAMRASKNNEKKIVPHYMFDIEAPSSVKGLKDGLKITSLRPYVYGETIGDNEIAFFVMAWPEDLIPKGKGKALASFPSINNHSVNTDHLIISDRIKLPDLLVKQLDLTSDYLESGVYLLFKEDVVY